MRSSLFLAVAMACLLTGCGGNFGTDDVGGVSVTIMHPSKSTIARSTIVGISEKGKPDGMRCTHSYTEPSGTAKEYVIEIVDSHLTVNGKGYGSVAKGESIVIDGDTLKVNGTERGASPPENSN